MEPEGPGLASLTSGCMPFPFCVQQRGCVIILRRVGAKDHGINAHAWSLGWGKASGEGACGLGFEPEPGGLCWASNPVLLGWHGQLIGDYSPRGPWEGRVAKS